MLEDRIIKTLEDLQMFEDLNIQMFDNPIIKKVKYDKDMYDKNKRCSGA